MMKIKYFGINSNLSQVEAHVYCGLGSSKRQAVLVKVFKDGMDNGNIGSSQIIMQILYCVIILAFSHQVIYHIKSATKQNELFGFSLSYELRM